MAVAMAIVFAPLLRAQQATEGRTPVTRAAAIEAALARGARLGVARADSAVAAATLVTARAWPDPTFNPTYSKDAPHYHALVDVPIELPGLRSSRIGAAQYGLAAAQYRYALERLGARVDADTTYTRVLANRALAALSQRSAADADSLRRMVVQRRDAGDASDLDVELATITAGQEANTAITDSLEYLSSVLDLQIVMGLTADSVAIEPSDSLATRSVSSGDALARSGSASPLAVAAAELALRSAESSLLTEKRSVWQSLGINGGIEWGASDEPGPLPTFGISLPLPLFSRNRGAIAQAEAERLRASAELTQARAESNAEIARTSREVAIADQKVQRDVALVKSARRVAAMSLTAYREGASTLPNVIEARRSARDVEASYIQDLAALLNLRAELSVLTMTPADLR